MVKLLLLIIVITAITNSIYSQSQWFWLDPLPTGATLNSVDFADRNTGYTCGKTGVVTKTTNGGVNWMLLNPVTVYELKAIKCFNENTCITVGAAGSIFKTTNGGVNWANIPSGVSTLLMDINFPTDQIGYISGSSGTFLKTTNGGNNWTFISVGVNTSLFSVSFTNSLKGALGGINNIYTTTNGGINWTTHPLGSFFDYFQTVNYVNDTTIYGLFVGLGVSKTFKSISSGLNWSNYGIESFITSEIARSLSFNNSGIGFIVSNFGNIHKSTNGGVNWLKDTSFTPGYLDVNIFYGIDRVDSNNFTAVGAGGIVIRTTNSGEVWEKQVGNLQTYNDTYFTDVITGYIVGEKGLLKKTTDAGVSWNNINLNTSLGLNKIFFVNQNTGYICGDTGLVKKTTNAGLNWITQATPAADTNLLSLHFVNENVGFIGTDGGSVLKTSNAGLNWRHVFTITGIGDRSTNDFDFLNENIGVVAATLSIYFTTNSGENWTARILPGTYLNSINYLDSNNIIAFGLKDKIIKSTNGGQTFFNINNQLGATIFSSQFFGSEYGIICGDLGRVGRTTNGGINWTLQPFVASEYLYSIYFADPNTGFAVGQAGQIIKSTNGGLSFINFQTTLVPANYILQQNYPNPFNPKTLINYEIKKSGVIRINVYDAAGKFIKSLTNKYHSAGEYSLEFDASGFPSGVYFYSLFSENILISTRKSLLIK